MRRHYLEPSLSLMEVRVFNKRNVIELISKKPLTKRDIVNNLGLSQGTVVTIVGELINEGLIQAGEVLKSTGGRKPVVYKLVENAKIVLGVAITSNHIRFALGNWGQEVIDKNREERAFENSEEYWKRINDLIIDIMDRNSVDKDKFLGINFVVDGVILPNGGIEDMIPIGEFSEIDILKIKESYDFPVFFCNHIKAAAFSNIGKPSNRQTYVYLHIDKRVGGAVINNGTYWGLSNRTGEFGHMYMGESGEQCECGNYGCLQTFCSSDALRRVAGMEIDKFFVNLVKEDSVCIEIWESYKSYLIQAIYNLWVIFNIDIMIGGEMTQYLRTYKDDFNKVLVAKDIYKEGTRYLRFSNRGEYDAAIGAALIILEKEEYVRKKL